MTRTLLRGVPGFVYLNSPDILWVAPACAVALFVVMAAGLTLLLQVPRATFRAATVAALFSSVACAGLLLTLGKMSQVASLILSVGVALQLRRWMRGREDACLSFFRRTFGPLLALVVVIGVVGFEWDSWSERAFVRRLPPPRAGAPNLLLITLDTLRADHVSAYGYERRTTPNLDRLAESGVLFENAIANSSWTLPAHASLFTGRLQHEHKADWFDPLDRRYPTLAEVLAGQGYATAAFVANTMYVTPESGLARGFTRFNVYGSSLADDVVRTIYGKKLALNFLPRVGYFEIPGRKRASQVSGEFFHWLDTTGGRPFFAFLNYLEVHDPYLPISGYETKFSAQVTRGDLINFQFQPQVFRRKPTLTREEIRSEVDSYDACLSYLDAQLGALFHELAARGLEKSTLIIVTADHGEAFGNHDLFGHGNSLYIETLRVPLVFVWPGMIPAGKRIASVVSLHRIPATIMALFGSSASVSLFPGGSLVPLWSSGSRDDAGDAALSEVNPGRFKEGPSNYPTTSGWLKSVVTDRWHLLRSETGRTEIYAWQEDREEAHDVSATPGGAAAIADLERLVRSP